MVVVVVATGAYSQDSVQELELGVFYPGDAMMVVVEFVLLVTRAG